MLDFAFWKSQMAGDPAAVGRDIQLNGEPFTVVGVLPAGFSFGGAANVWVPLALDRVKPNNRGSHYLDVLARLGTGVSPAQAAADLDELARKLATTYPRNYPADSGFGMFLRPLRTDLVGDARPGLLVVFAAVGFVLLIACINLANLLLARGSSRSREIAIRGALGAGRLRIVRQLVTESVVIALAGGGCGLLLAVWTTDTLKRTAALALPETRPIEIDSAVLLFAAGVSLLTGIVFGAAPALRASSSQVYGALKDAARGSTGGGHRLRTALAVSEIAIALVLLVAAGLTARSLRQLLDVHPGFEPEHMLTARISLPAAGYRDNAATTAFFDRLQQRVETLPGIRNAGLTTLLPLTGRSSSGSTYIDRASTPGLTMSPQFQRPYFETDQRFVTPSFLPTMQVTLLRGRMFTSDDRAGAPPVAIVDEEFAKRIWPDRDPVGERISINAIPDGNPPVLEWRTVVGVASHVRNNSLDQLGREQTYVPLDQAPFPVRNMYLSVRTAAEPAAIASAIQQAVHALDPSLPVYEVKAMVDWVDSTVSPRRFNVMMLAAFGALALALAAVGTYGVISYSVGQRTQEIGIRMALGASRGDVLRMVVGGGLKMAAGGVLIGIALALALGRFLVALLFGINPTDPATFLVVSATLVITAALAAWIPARRATRVEPVIALRAE